MFTPQQGLNLFQKAMGILESARRSRRRRLSGSHQVSHLANGVLKLPVNHEEIEEIGCFQFNDGRFEAAAQSLFVLCSTGDQVSMEVPDQVGVRPPMEVR